MADTRLKICADCHHVIGTIDDDDATLWIGTQLNPHPPCPTCHCSGYPAPIQGTVMTEAHPPDLGAA